MPAAFRISRIASGSNWREVGVMLAPLSGWPLWSPFVANGV